MLIRLSLVLPGIVIVKCPSVLIRAGWLARMLVCWLAGTLCSSNARMMYCLPFARRYSDRCISSIWSRASSSSFMNACSSSNSPGLPIRSKNIRPRVVYRSRYTNTSIMAMSSADPNADSIPMRMPFPVVLIRREAYWSGKRKRRWSEMTLRGYGAVGSGCVEVCDVVNCEAEVV